MNMLAIKNKSEYMHFVCNFECRQYNKAILLNNSPNNFFRSHFVNGDRHTLKIIIIIIYAWMSSVLCAVVKWHVQKEKLCIDFLYVKRWHQCYSQYHKVIVDKLIFCLYIRICNFFEWLVGPTTIKNLDFLRKHPSKQDWTGILEYCQSR